MRSVAWMDAGNCTTAARPDAFFPEVGQTAVQAKKVCNGTDGVHEPCPIRGVCLEYAIDEEILDGVWGGMSALERQRLRGKARGPKTHCKHGHEFTEENTYRSTKPDGSPRRQCRACGAARERARRLAA